MKKKRVSWPSSESNPVLVNPKTATRSTHYTNRKLTVIGKGKDHKAYEYGNKISIAATAKSNIIVGVVSHPTNIYDYHTLPEVLKQIKKSRGKGVKKAVCDRGYKGKNKVGSTDIVLPKPPPLRETIVINGIKSETSAKDARP